MRFLLLIPVIRLKWKQIFIMCSIAGCRDEAIQVGLTEADKSISFTEAQSDNNSQFIIMPLTL